MPYRLIVLAWALVAVTACDRGAKVYEKGAAAEQAGQLEDARWQYQSVVNNFPKSEKVADAKRGYVRISLDMAEKALTAGDLNTAQTRLGEAQPLLDDEADKARFKKVMAAERAAGIAARQAEEIRAWLRRINALALDEKRTKPSIDTQAAFKWEEYIVPNMNPAQRIHLHLGQNGSVERREFDFGAITPKGNGRYVLDVVTTTSAESEKAEWFIQNTTNGWRLVCAQRSGESSCKDPWVYKSVKQ